MASPQEHYREVVRIVELADETGYVADRAFVDCEILGPAVLAPTSEDVHFVSNSFVAPSIDAVLWEVPPDRTFVGATGLRAVTFTKCRLHNIGVVGPPEFLARFRLSV